MNDFSIKFEELIESLVQKFTPEIVVICKRILFLDNVEANKNVDLYNEYFKCTYGPKPGFLMLKLNTMVKSNNN